jgi:hypothetical protein
MNLKTTIARLFRRVDHDERGTALTEFTICLPVFVMLFIIITNLGQLQVEGVGVMIQANKEMWGNAIPVQKKLVDIVHQSPQLAAVQGGAQVINNFSDYPIADATLGGSYIGLLAGGTNGEKMIPTLVGGIASAGISPIFMTEPVTNSFARDVFNDTFPNPVMPVGGAIAVWDPALAVPPTSFIVPRQAIAAGNRYGQEQGAASKVHSTVWGNKNLSADYRVQVAPRPVEAFGLKDWIPIGYSRLGAEQYQCFREVLGINWTQPFIGCPIMPPFYLTSRATYYIP